MARIIYISFLWLLIVFSFGDVSAQQDSIVYQNWGRDPNTDIESTVSNQKQIITKEQILYSGYTLLSDLLQLVDGWTMSTWNGDRWNLQSNGSGNYQVQNWTLLLNGQRIELMKLDARHINTIGISVSDIERVEVINVAGNYLGEFNDKGIIHIITKKNAAGLTYRGFASNGNEIGDPHMNALNDPHLNIHEYGTSFGNYFGFRKNKWDIQASQYLNNYFYRDTTPLLFRLVRRYNPNVDFANTILSGRVQVTYTSGNITHQLTGMISRTDDVIMPAGIFPPVTGKNNYNTIGYTMRYALPQGVLQYRNSLIKRSFTGDQQRQISHEQYYQTHNLNYTTRQATTNGYRITQTGVAFDHIITGLLDTTATKKQSTYLIRPYYSLTYQLTKKSNVFADISVTTNFENVLPKLALGYYKQSSLITNWSFVTSFAQRSVAENNSYFSMLPQLDTSLSYITGEVSGLASLDYYYNININKYFKISFNSGLKHLENELAFQPVTTPGTSSLLLYTRIGHTQQTRWVNRLNIHYDMFKNTRFDINYLRTAEVNDEWLDKNNIPRHRFSFILLQSLPSRFNVWIRYYYQSSSYWLNPAFVMPPVTITSQDLYARQAPMHSFDAGITKRLLRDYLTTNFSVRNVFNNYEHYQANGASFYMRLFISVRLNIDGLFAKSITNP